MDEADVVLKAAREAFGCRDWAAGLKNFRIASQEVDLTAADLSAFGDCAWWCGDVPAAVSAYEGAYRLFLHGDQPHQAALHALGLAFSLLLRGDLEIGSGWMNRAQRLLRDEPETAQHGYLLYLDAEIAFAEGDLDKVLNQASELIRMGSRYADANLAAGGVLFEGRALVRRGELGEGMRCLDEAMVAVLSDELASEWAGNIYCHLMDVFHELGDIRRAAEWVEATQRWLDQLPAAVLFSGICRVHRSQVLQIIGAWDQAEREAARVSTELAAIHVAAAAEAHYQVAEIRRLRGDLAAAERSYERAHEYGRDPQPGLSLLRLAEGRLTAAASAIQTALIAESDNRLARVPLCAAQVDIALGTGSLDDARRACEELEATAAVYASSGIEATARHARGALTLAEGKPGAALPILRDACRRWREAGADYLASKACLLLVQVYGELGDEDAARRELDAAAPVFDRLGAVPDANLVERLRRPPTLPHGLTQREAEVLALVATGRSNKDVATALYISEKTVARHLSNIFSKIDVATRTEAAAFAFEHGLASPTRG
jgi:ATP/maltotriose-dependent transcriptional regulator MalT